MKYISYHTVPQDVIPRFQTWIDVVNVPLERFTLQFFSEFSPLGHITYVNSMVLCADL